MNKFLYVIGASVLVVGFQNCAKTNFSSANGGSSYLAALDGNGETLGGTPTPPTQPTPPTTPVEECVAPTPPVSSGYGGHSAHSSCATMHNSTGQENLACKQDADTDYVACIIKENGKSLKLGLVQNKLDGVTSVAQSVCITKAECLGDVAKSFGVNGAYQRGYCEHNPNVQRLSDSQVKSLLGI